LFPLLGERLVETETQETIAGATDLGDRMLERGTIVGSAVQQADGSPVAGVLIEAQRNEDPYDFFHEVLADANGLFHGPVPADTMVQIRGTVFDDALSDFRIDAESDPTDDVIVYPATVVGPAGFVSGLVRDAGTTSPLGDITVLGFEEDPMNPGMLGNFIEQTFTCPDGTYDLKLPAGPHFIQFSDFENGVYAPEFYADAYCPSGASTVTVPDGGSVTANADLGPGGTISGTVTAGGFLHAGAIVCADSVLLGNCTVACTTS
ncbi:MAG: hypothetical protein GTN89_10125, partial [Acidobacteria bacterium]|nr:hypothetical protein [Acidobacteriota bacterium]NIO60358.1 hypothetical protein [Acidobacteriota bacterium]NIQ30710.1 hypothetical protein [Acidobacteriota bacterium]NIQ85706.1 hypothetical protein [Acidobacteriota bacterium]